MNGERQWYMSHILYISAANYDRKHLENSKLGLEKSWIFFLQKSGNPVSASYLHWLPVITKYSSKLLHLHHKTLATCQTS